MRLKTILTGSGILVFSLVAMFLLGQVLNPPAQQVFVAAREIQAGEVLTPDLVQLVSVRLPSTAPYLTRAEIETYGYAQVVEPIHAGMFIPKAALSFAGNPAAGARVSLALADPGLVAMTIPVTPLTSPAGIVPGDKVSLNVSVGSATLMNGSFSSGQSAPSGPDAGSNPFAGLPGLPETGAGPGNLPTSTPLPTPTAEPVISLPVTKNLVVSGRVLDVVYETRFNTSAASPNGNPAPAAVGDILALVVAVPRDAQEALAFSIANGEVRVAVLDPNAPDDPGATAGMSWEDLVAYFRWQRQEWLASDPALDAISPPGAAAVVPTLMATTYPTATPLPSRTPARGSGPVTPTPSPTPGGPANP